MAIQLVSPSHSEGAAGPVQKTTPTQAQAARQAKSEAVPDADPNPERIRKAVRDIQRAVEPMATNLNFSIDEESGKTVIRVVDSTTRELIRQIPSEEVMSISRALSRLAGLLVQEKA